MQNYTFFCYYLNKRYSFADLFFWKNVKSIVFSTKAGKHFRKSAMKTFQSKAQINRWVLNQKSAGKTVGFVPTMGALHEGHLSLIQKAKQQNDLVVCSIFVNPIQFNKPEDLEKYPRTLEADMEMLRRNGCDAVFTPSEKEMYPKPEQKVYDFGILDKIMEGRYRRGHFNGVAIVVKKLFEIVQPHRAYFGEKDFQQLQIIKAMVKMESLDVGIVACSTVREPDGLAMSSRNVRLNKEQRTDASLIHASLKMAKRLYKTDEISDIKKRVAEMINASPHLDLEYFEIVWANTLLPVYTKEERKEEVVGCIAVYAGEIRLIDNMAFNS